MRYSGKLYYPAGAELHLDIEGLSAIQGNTAYELYAQFKSAMDNDEFDARVEGQPEANIRPVQLRFRKSGQTAAYVLFEREADGAGVSKLEAALALLGRLDPQDDAAAVDVLRNDPDLKSLAPGDFDSARADGDPLAAAFFTGDASLNDPLLHGLMNLAGAAFFDRLGLLS